MKVILKHAVPNLGEPGDVVSVKPGYGRNYLLPQDLAYVATPGNLKRIEEEKVRGEERARRDYLEARRRASQFEDVVLVFHERAHGDEDDAGLFGSVTTAQIADELNGRGLDFEIDRKQVLLDEPIKALGTYRVPVHLNGEVEVEVEVRVEREDG
jgi:large subunit ribosomal protein L9